MKNCRICHGACFNEPILKYGNMPRAAQYLPDDQNLSSDVGIELEVVQCSQCGLIQLNQPPVPYYREVIRAASVSKEMTAFRIAQFKHFIDRFALWRKKFIEIGCGRGEYLSILERCGVEAYGIEYAEASVKEGRKQGLKIMRGSLERKTDRLPNAPFDAFVILNFLEHLPDPREVLQGIRNNLSEGGVGLVEVPNFDMILRNHLFAEFISDHLVYFTHETLRTALNLSGFNVIEIQETWHDYILSAVVRTKERLDTASFERSRQNLKRDIHSFLNRYPGRAVAVWGAGHQAFVILSLMGLADKISYVVDSAKFKQGRYTPATHIPIVSPAALDKDPVAALIVMAASYSDEVVGIIREKFGNAIDVAILREDRLEVA